MMVLNNTEGVDNTFLNECSSKMLPMQEQIKNQTQLKLLNQQKSSKTHALFKEPSLKLVDFNKEQIQRQLAGLVGGAGGAGTVTYHVKLMLEKKKTSLQPQMTYQYIDVSPEQPGLQQLITKQDENIARRTFQLKQKTIQEKEKSQFLQTSLRQLSPIQHELSQFNVDSVKTSRLFNLTGGMIGQSMNNKMLVTRPVNKVHSPEPVSIASFGFSTETMIKNFPSLFSTSCDKLSPTHEFDQMKQKRFRYKTIEDSLKANIQKNDLIIEAKGTGHQNSTSNIDQYRKFDKDQRIKTDKQLQQQTVLNADIIELKAATTDTSDLEKISDTPLTKEHSKIQSEISNSKKQLSKRQNAPVNKINGKAVVINEIQAVQMPALPPISSRGVFQSLQNYFVAPTQTTWEKKMKSVQKIQQQFKTDTKLPQKEVTLHELFEKSAVLNQLTKPLYKVDSHCGHDISSVLEISQMQKTSTNENSRKETTKTRNPVKQYMSYKVSGPYEREEGTETNLDTPGSQYMRSGISSAESYEQNQTQIVGALFVEDQQKQSGMKTSDEVKNRAKRRF